MSTYTPFVNEIRHEHTNYDRLAAYYNAQKKYRTKLNQTIMKLINGQITIPEFRERVAVIEASVDLTRKPNQKRFIKWRRDSMLHTGHYTTAQANAIAKNNLASTIKLQTCIDAGKYRPGIFDSFVKHVHDGQLS